MRFSIVLDSKLILRKWQFNALNIVLQNGHQLETIYLCSNTKKPKKTFGNLFYFLLAGLTRTRLESQRKVDISNSEPFRSARIVAFSATTAGSWQEIPSNIINKENTGDLIVRLGMSLILNPEKLGLRHGIISYHHGDPSKFRGRPAGYYELESNEKIVGVVVQQIGNKIDRGVLLAKGYSKVFKYSYRRTIEELYKTGEPLLNLAFRNLEAISNPIDQTSSGNNYRLPSNKSVTKFILRLTTNFINRLISGVFIGKHWSIGTMSSSLFWTDPPNSKNVARIPSAQNAILTADPFIDAHGNIYAEVITTGRTNGKIFRFHESKWARIDFPISCHVSYPQTLVIDGEDYLFPEISQRMPPMLFKVNNLGVEKSQTIRIKGITDPRLIDATLFFHKAKWYLFCNLRDRPRSELYLYSSDSIGAEFESHPMNPIVSDPRNGRMGGSIHFVEGQIFRVAQDLSGDYGDGVQIYEILILTSVKYQEMFIRNFKFEDVKGPHTISFTRGSVVLDFYEYHASLHYFMIRIKGLFVK